MSDALLTDGGSASGSLKRFTPEPFVADGGYSFGGLMMLTGVLGFAGMILGILASWVSQYFYLIILFPCAIGFGVGLAGVFGIKQFKIRQPMLCGLAGCAAGVFAMLAMHYGDYRRLMSVRDEHIPAELQAVVRNLDAIKKDIANQPEETQQLVKELEADPEFLKVVKINTLWQHIDYKAHEGVELKGKRGKGINIGYTGSYIYWGVEVLIVAGIALAVMKSSAEEPFCTDCESWKKEVEHGEVGGASADLAAAVREGDLPLAHAIASGPKGDSLITLWSCPNCGAEAPVDVAVKAVSTNSEGKVEKKDLCKVTYPPEAHEDLTLLAYTTPDVAPLESSGASDAEAETQEA
jgi:hypothetical protein